MVSSGSRFVVRFDCEERTAGLPVRGTGRSRVPARCGVRADPAGPGFRRGSLDAAAAGGEQFGQDAWVQSQAQVEHGGQDPVGVGEPGGRPAPGLCRPRWRDGCAPAARAGLPAARPVRRSACPAAGGHSGQRRERRGVERSWPCRLAARRCAGGGGVEGVVPVAVEAVPGQRQRGHLRIADLDSGRVTAGSSSACTVRPVRVVVAAMLLTTTSWLVSGLPRQFMVMWENSRCSILFHLEVPGGKWHT